MAATTTASSDAIDYDLQWNMLDDFIRFNPGARHRRRWILNQLHKLHFSSLLDVGCGNGELLIAILRGGPGSVRLKGVDVSKVAIEKNQQRLPSIEFETLDIQSEKLSDRFDVLINSEVIEHVANLTAAFENLAAMLKPGGTLLLTCPTGRVYATERKFGHTIHPTVARISELAKANQLTVTKMSNWGFPFYGFLKWVTNVNPGWSMENFASGKYSRSSRLISHFCYYFNFLNIPSSPLGCQLLISLQKQRI